MWLTISSVMPMGARLTTQASAVHALLGQGVQRRLGDVDHFLGGLVAARSDHQHGSAYVGGNIRIEVELKGGVLAFEVRPLAQDEVVLSSSSDFIFVEDIFEDQGVLTGVDQLPGLFEGVSIGVAVGDGQLEVAGSSDRCRDPGFLRPGH